MDLISVSFGPFNCFSFLEWFKMKKKQKQKRNERKKKNEIRQMIYRIWTN